MIKDINDSIDNASELYYLLKDNLQNVDFNSLRNLLSEWSNKE